MFAKIGCLCCVALALAGCHETREQLSEAEITSIARQTFYNREKWRGDISVKASKADGTWTVTVWCEPKTPGGFRTLDISGDGKVLRYNLGE